MINLTELKDKVVLLLTNAIFITDVEDAILFYGAVPVDEAWPYGVVDLPEITPGLTKQNDDNITVVRITAFDDLEWYEGFGRIEAIIEQVNGIIEQSAECIWMENTRVIQAAFISTSQSKTGEEFLSQISFSFDLTE